MTASSRDSSVARSDMKSIVALGALASQLSYPFVAAVLLSRSAGSSRVARSRNRHRLECLIRAGLDPPSFELSLDIELTFD